MLTADKRLPHFHVTEIPVAGIGGVPADAKAVALNLTAHNPRGPGFFTAYPCDGPRPIVSNLNFVAGQIVAASAIVPIGANGKVCVFQYGDANLIVDVTGSFNADSGLVPVWPTRAIDTRETPARAGPTPTVVHVGAVPGVPADRSSVVVNLTTIGYGNGVLDVYPCDATAPPSPTRTIIAGEIQNLLLISAVDANGDVCVTASTPIDVIVDVFAGFTAAADVHPLPSTRVFDSGRHPAGRHGVDDPGHRPARRGRTPERGDAVGQRNGGPVTRLRRGLPLRVGPAEHVDAQHHAEPRAGQQHDRRRRRQRPGLPVPAVPRPPDRRPDRLDRHRVHPAHPRPPVRLASCSRPECQLRGRSATWALEWVPRPRCAQPLHCTADTPSPSVATGPSGARLRSMIFDGYVHQLPDTDPDETQEWLDSLDAVVDTHGKTRARFLLSKLLERARESQVSFPATVSTPYVNTIPREAEPWFPGDEHIERRIRAFVRWNAAAMVVRANKHADGIGGHLSTFASSASLYEIGFNHFFRGKDDGTAGDHVYFQGHAAPGVYARAFMEGRLTEDDLDHFRRRSAAAAGACRATRTRG